MIGSCPTLMRATLAVRKRLKEKAIRIHKARTRWVYEFKHYVIKVPINAEGLRANDWEGSVSNEKRRLKSKRYLEYWVQYPRTRLYYFKDIPLVLMELIAPLDWSKTCYDDQPDWVGSVDCGQVGYTKKGRLVAYDYG